MEEQNARMQAAEAALDDDYEEGEIDLWNPYWYIKQVQSRYNITAKHIKNNY